MFSRNLMWAARTLTGAVIIKGLDVSAGADVSVTGSKTPSSCEWKIQSNMRFLCSKAERLSPSDNENTFETETPCKP